MNLSPKGADLIAGFEGGQSPDGMFRPYWDAHGGVWTIGFGSTKGVGPNSTPLTREQALRRMMREIDATYGAAVNALKLPLTQNQFDALVSFVYNVGPGGIASSTSVGRLLRNRQWRMAADALLAWDKAGGRRLAGLTRRRQAERELFLTAPELSTLEHYTPAEQRWIHEYDRLKRTGSDPRRLAVLRRVMTEQRKRVWVEAQKTGWDRANRRARYRSLLARTR